MKTPTEHIELPRRSSDDIMHLPGDKGALPILGDTVEFLTDYLGLVTRKHKLYGTIFRNNALLQRSIALLGPEANELVLKDSDKIFSSKKAWDPILDRLFPDGLMLRDFDEHRFHRRILQAAFKKDALQGYLDDMNPRMREGVAAFPKKVEFGFKDSIKSLLLDVAAQVFMGVKMGSDADAINKGFLHAMEASMAVVKLPIPGTTWQKGLNGRKTLKNFIEKHIESKRAAESSDFFS
ncbi:MAG: cytochrome P450, partial [Zhongshania sp.]